MGQTAWTCRKSINEDKRCTSKNWWRFAHLLQWSNRWNEGTIDRSTTPKAGDVFSGIGKNHVGIVLKVDGYNITIQDDNYDGITNTFEDAKKDWQTNTYTLDYYRLRMGCIIFANPK